MWWSGSLLSDPNSHASFCRYSSWSKPPKLIVVTKWLQSFLPWFMCHFSVTLQTDREVWYFLVHSPLHWDPSLFNDLVLIYSQLRASMISLQLSLSSFYYEVFQKAWAFCPNPKSFPLMSNQHLDENMVMILFKSRFK